MNEECKSSSGYISPSQASQLESDHAAILSIALELEREARVRVTTLENKIAHSADLEGKFMVKLNDYKNHVTTILNQRIDAILLIEQQQKYLEMVQQENRILNFQLSGAQEDLQKLQSLLT